MSWLGIQGHDAVAAQFRQALRTGRLASTFLFIGPPGIGKALFARALAQSLLCQQNTDVRLEACRQCPACQQVTAETHPDLHILRLPEGKSFIPLESLIGSKEHRSREGLCRDIAIKPIPGSRKIAIIDDADYLNPEGANALLKTLEEPPPRAIIILIGTSQQRQLPTIRSRSQVIRFQPLPLDVLSELIQSRYPQLPQEEVERIGRLSGGRLDRIEELVDAEQQEFRGKLFSRLSSRDLSGPQLTQLVTSHVDEAGKESSARRERLRRLLTLVLELSQQICRTWAGLSEHDDPAITAAAQAIVHQHTVHQHTHHPNPARDGEHLAQWVELSLDALRAVDANANLNCLIPCWSDEVSRIVAGERLLSLSL